MALSSRTSKIAAVVVVVIVVIAVAYAGLTFPRTIAEFPIAFSAGPDETKIAFDVPPLNDKVQVEVSLPGNSTSWIATIDNADGQELWTYNGLKQENQTVYHSAWIPLQSGSYNFSFAIGGSEAINAEISLSSKGDLW